METVIYYRDTCYYESVLKETDFTKKNLINFMINLYDDCCTVKVDDIYINPKYNIEFEPYWDYFTYNGEVFKFDELEYEF